MTILKTSILLTLNEGLVYHVNYISIKLLKYVSGIYYVLDNGSSRTRGLGEKDWEGW